MVGLAAGLWIPGCFLFHPLAEGGFFWIPKWLPVWALPGVAGVAGAGSLLLHRSGLRWALAAALLLALVLQIGLIWPGLRLLDGADHHPGIYDSHRQYLSVGGKTLGWEDPARLKEFELGRGVRLVMATTVPADAARRTLPVAPGQGPPRFSLAQAASPLSPAGAENLIALARAVGYLRYFHPTDQAAEADWNRLTWEGVMAIEGASHPGELANRLTALFCWVAPGVQFMGPGQEPVPRTMPAGTAYWVRWRHHGLGELPAPGHPWLFWEDRTTRLACVAILWSALQHFHPFLDEPGHDWAAELPKALKAAAVAEPQGFPAILRRLMAALADGHAEVHATWNDLAMPPVRLRVVNDRVWVEPSEAVPEGLPPGSELLEMDGEPIRVLLRRWRREISSASEGWLRAKLAMRLLTGPMGSTLRVGYRTPAGTLGETTLVRSAEGPPYAALPACRWPAGICYVDLGRMSVADYRRREPELRAARVIIADLRNHLRSFRDAEEFLSRLSSRPMICPRWEVAEILLPDRQGWRWTTEGRWLVLPRGRRLPGKVVFLVDGGVISAGETFLSFVEQYGLGEILGEPTAGCNGDINRNPALPGGSVVWTGMRLRKQDGGRHLGVGIRPTLAVSATCQGSMEGRDEILERALDWARQAAETHQVGSGRAPGSR
jgi:hypothetical protein